MKKLVEETAEKIKGLDLTDRFDRGMPGELCVEAALKQQIIPNTRYEWGNTVTAELYSKKWEAEVLEQRVNGDLIFVHPKTFKRVPIDVKNVAWVSMDSLRDFREDGYFLFNAWYRPTAEDYKLGRRRCIHFMVKNCQEFKDFIAENVKPTRRSRKGSLGYEISFNDMKPEWLYNDFDADEYSRLMKNVWDECDFWALQEAARDKLASNAGYGSEES